MPSPPEQVRCGPSALPVVCLRRRRRQPGRLQHLLTRRCCSCVRCLHAVMEMSLCLNDARDDPRIGVVILTGR
jgi:hypothetical protein